MKKLFLVLWVAIMFFGIVGCPENSSDKLTTKSSITSPSTLVSSADGPSTGDNPSAVPEPATLILLGSGLVSLAVIGRNRFKK